MKRFMLLAFVCLIALSTPRPQAQGGRAGATAGGSAAGPGGAGAPAGLRGDAITGPNGSFGTFAPWVPDASRPKGFRVRQEMDNPSAKLYNTAKQKLFDGKQLSSWTQNRPDPEQYCMMAPTL